MIAPRLLLTILLFFTSCDSSPAAGGVDPLRLGDEERQFVVVQRTTTTVPGCMGRISLKVGDVETGAGVEHVAVIDHKDESQVAASRRLTTGGSLRFRIDGVPYTLVLTEFDGTHLVNDTATLVLRSDP